MADEDKVSVQFGAQIAGLTAGIKQATAQVEGFGQSISGLQSMLTGFGEALIAAFAVERLAAFVEHITNLGEQVDNTSKILGIAAEQLTAFQFAAATAGVEGESAAMSLSRLERNMVLAQRGTGPAAEAFKALGVSLRDNQGNLKTLDQILPQIADRFRETADGPEKVAIAMAVMGRAGMQMIPFLDEGAEGLEHWKSVLAATGADVAPFAEGLHHTHDALYVMGQAVQGVALTLFEAFKPAIDSVIEGLTSLIIDFNNALKSSSLLHDALTALVVVFDTIIAVLATASTGVQQLWHSIAGGVTSILIALNTLGTAMQDAFRGDWSKLKDDVSAGLKAIEDEVKRRAEAIRAAGEEWKKTMQGLFSNIGAGGVDVSPPPSKPSPAKPRLPEIGEGEKVSQIEQWRQQLAEQLIDSQNFYGDMRAAELAFWQDKLKIATEHSKLWYQVQAQIFPLLRALAQEELRNTLSDFTYKQTLARDDFTQKLALEDEKLALLKLRYGEDSRQYIEELRKKFELEQDYRRQQNALQLSANNTERQIRGLAIEGTKQDLDAQVALEQITSARKYQILRDLYEQKYELDLQALRDELALLDLGVAERQKVNERILVLQAQHEQDMKQLTRQATIAQRNEYMDYIRGVTGAVNTMMNGILQGTQSFSDLAARSFQNMAATFVQIVDEMIIKWLAFKALGLGSNPFGGGGGGGGLIDIIGSIIPGLDIGAYNVPRDMVAQIHKGEMVVPAVQAAEIRRGGAPQVFGGAYERFSGGTTGPAIGAIHIHATDAQSFRAMLKREPNAIADALRMASRNFVPVPKR